MPESLGTTVTGTFGVADVFLEQRKYDKDKSKFFIWRERGHAALVHVLITKLNKVSVTDPEPRHFEDGYRKFEFTTTDTGGGSTELILATADANQLQEGDLLKIEGKDAEVNWTHLDESTLIMTFGARSTTYTTEEVVEVVSKAAPAGGNVVITVTRGIGADTVTAPPNIGDGLKVWHIGEVSEDGSGSRTSFSQNPVVVNNFIQEFKVPYEITNIAAKTDIFGEDEWQRKARTARKNFARRLDRAFYSGRKYKKTGTGGQLKWYTGGIDEWIPGDNRISAGRPLTQTYLNTLLCNTVFLTGSEQKFGTCGYGFIGKLSNVAADKLRYNQKMSDDLGWDVHTFTSAGGGVLHLLPDLELSSMGKGDELYCIDVMYTNYMYFEGEDIYIDKGRGGLGLQANDETKLKHQIKGIVGLKRSFRDSHFHLYNFS